MIVDLLGDASPAVGGIADPAPVGGSTDTAPVGGSADPAPVGGTAAGNPPFTLPFA